MAINSSLANFQNPDFAFPATVITDAEAVLADSSPQQPGLTRLLALLQIVRATGDIGSDARFDLPALISRAAGQETHADVRGLMYLLQARTVYDIYEGGRFKYNGVTQVTPRPDDIREWSGEDFKAEIKRLTEKSSEWLSAYYSAPLSDYSEVVTCDSLSQDIFPYLRDFLWTQIITMTSEEAESVCNNAALLSPEGSAEWAWWTLGGLDSVMLDLPQIKSLLPLANSDAAKVLIMLNWLRKASSAAEKFDAYTAAEAFLKTAPKTPITELLAQHLCGYLDPYVEIDFSAVAAPGEDVAFILHHNFSSKVGLIVRKTEDHDDVPVFEISLDTDSTQFDIKEKIEHSFKTPGIYQVSSRLNGKSQNWGTQTLIISPVLVTFISGSESNLWLVTDTRTGAPVSGIRLSIGYEAGVSDANGLVKLTGVKSGSCNITATLPDGTAIKFPETVYMSEEYIGDYEIDYRGKIYFSRPLYRPGETAECAVVVSKVDRNSARVWPEAKICLQWENASGEIIYSDTVTTDQYGRATSRLTLPATAMAGRYNVNVRNVESGRHVAYGGVMVSEYKRPVFELVDVDIEQVADSIVIRGRAERFTGAAVPGAKVTADISEFHWWANSEKANIVLETVTDRQGRFNMSFPSDSLNEFADVQVLIRCVAPSGDVADATERFHYQPEAVFNFKSTDFDCSAPFKVDVSLNYGLRKPFYPVVNWKLLKDRQEVASGSSKLEKDGMEVDWTKIPAGNYELNVTADGCAYYTIDVILYNIKRNLVPDDSVDVIHETKLYAAPLGNVDATIGVPARSYVYVISTDDNGEAEIRVEKLDKGFHNLTLRAASSGSKTYTILTIRGALTSLSHIRVEARDLDRRVWLRGEAWRDKIMPATPQHWRLRFEDAQNNSVSGAMIATLFNRALLSYVDNDWSDLQRIFTIFPKDYGFHTDFLWDLHGHVVQVINGRYETGRIRIPVFKYISEGTNTRITLFASNMMAKSIVSDKHSRLEGVVGTDSVEEEVAFDSEAEAPAMAAGAVMPVGEKPIFRNAETLQIFWKPNVTIGSDGVAEIEFDMPDAIGSWQFNAVAWDMSGRTANLSAALESSKPLTIEGNVPRFVRAGDSVSIPATVINRTSETVSATVSLETFDISTGKILDSFSSDVSLDATAQRQVALDIKVDGTLPMIGFRALVTGADFTDGEQISIPVLEASVKAVDSEIFYLDGERDSVRLTIPADKSGDGFAALTFCGNPVWDVVKALPALYDFTPKSATAAVNSLFGAMVAKGIAVNHPEIVTVVDEWVASPADSALVSPLKKNEDLKILTLGCTPFVGASDYMTRQMQRLAVTLDPEQSSAVADVAVGVLERLQQPDGGFSWIEWNPESSLFITEYVVQLIGRLNRLGFTDARTDSIVSRAFGFIDSHIDRLGERQAAYLYSLYPGRQMSDVVRKSVEKGVAEVKKDWRKDAVAFKALDAMILDAYGHKTDASAVIRSIAEFAVASPTVGLEIPSVTLVDSYAQILEAVATVDPKSQLIDSLRKWLVLKTQTTDDLGAWNPTELIAAMLATGSGWTTLGDIDAHVTIDGAPVLPSKLERATGTFTLRLKGSDAVRTVEVSRREGVSVPSYGSLITVAEIDLDSVAPSDCGELSIMKRMLVLDGDGWRDASSFEAGQKVKVQLTLRASREMEYVTVVDARPAGFEPVNQMPGRAEGGSTLWAYRTNDLSTTDFFIGYLPEGVNYLEYEVIPGHAGEFMSGVATVQSQYAPEFTARSGARKVSVFENR
ncbi:MAG: hypothetical protein K2M19_06955 [Muribaculaceae bacterium]|nr:hypothetical protein [Muribaculaceae bacterium]